ncbi:hypothetical protein PMAYCL1PPCAC_22151, partial [Pristionchus mayeri]
MWLKCFLLVLIFVSIYAHGTDWTEVRGCEFSCVIESYDKRNAALHKCCRDHGSAEGFMCKDLLGGLDEEENRHSYADWRAYCRFTAGEGPQYTWSESDINAD